MLFSALYPPCLATTIVGLTLASLVYNAGTALGLTGLETMSLAYFSALGLALAVGLAGRRAVGLVCRACSTAWR